jgi:hypothetical protein
MMTAEILEPRRLLAGLTLFTHGQDGDVDGWIDAAAEGVADRPGGPDVYSIFTMRVRENAGGDLEVTFFQPDSGYGDYRRTSGGELIIKLDWSTVSGGEFSSGEVAQAVVNYMLGRRTTKRLEPLAELPMHLVGHSRGASVVVEMSRLLGRRGVVVDHVTYLDPHPVDGENDFLGVDFGDAPMRVHDNVVFADNYWRDDGRVLDFDPDGERVSGTFDGDLNANVQENHFVSAHGAVTAYYVGTIDTSTSDGGDHPVLGSWYGGDFPEKRETGFAFGRLAAVAARPLGGIGEVGGGSAARSDAGTSGSQFPNLLTLRPARTRFVQGGINPVRLKTLDRDSSITVRIFLDRDSNPYNDNATIVGKTTTAGGGDDFDGGRNYSKRVDASRVPPGNYRLSVRVTDSSGQSRWLQNGRVRVVAGDSSASASAPPAAPRTTSPFATTAILSADRDLSDLV